MKFINVWGFIVSTYCKEAWLVSANVQFIIFFFYLRCYLSRLRKVFRGIDHVKFYCRVEDRNVIRSSLLWLLYIIDCLVIDKEWRLKLFCSSSVPDPNKNQTWQLSQQWNNKHNNAANYFKDSFQDWFGLQRHRRKTIQSFVLTH